MSVVLGSGEYRYEVIENWGSLPNEWNFHEVAAVAVDQKDQVYCFTRGKHPVIVFDPDGNFLRSWGDGVFKRAHGATIGVDETIFLTDDGDHTVRQCSLDGKILLTIGVPGKAAPYQGGEPFNRCTHVAFSPRAIFMFPTVTATRACTNIPRTANCLLSWGESGSDPGQFNIVHNIVTDKDGWVYVADRENNRIQVFDGNGKYETQWNNMHRPCALYMDTTKNDPMCFVGELGRAWASTKKRRISATASMSTTKRASGWRAWAIFTPVRSRASSSRRTVSPSIRAAIFTSAKCRGQSWGSVCSRRANCAACKNSRSSVSGSSQG